MRGIVEQLSRTDTLTFDCYGTLIEWKAGLAESLRSIFGPQDRSDELFDAYVEEEAAEESGSYQSYRRVLTATVGRLAKRFGWDVPAARCEMLAELLPRWKPFPDTNEALARLKKRFRLGVLSNIDRDLFAGTAKHFGVTLDFVITAQDVKAYKPNLAHFRQAIETHGGAEGLLHVAQSLYHDGAVARQVGIPFVWINRYGQINNTQVTPLAAYPDLRSLADAADAAGS